MQKKIGIIIKHSTFARWADFQFGRSKRTVREIQICIRLTDCQIWEFGKCCSTVALNGRQQKNDSSFSLFFHPNNIRNSSHSEKDTSLIYKFNGTRGKKSGKKEIAVSVFNKRARTRVWGVSVCHNGIKKLAAALIAIELKNILPKVKHVIEAAATQHHNINLHSIEAIKLRRQHRFWADGPHFIQCLQCHLAVSGIISTRVETLPGIAQNIYYCCRIFFAAVLFH